MRAPNDRGFTPVEVLISIVLVGILAAVVVVGIGRLTDSANASGCAGSADAARTAVQTYFVGNDRYPVNFTEMTQPGTTGGPSLVVPAGATIDGRSITLNGWRLSMSNAGPPTFTCSLISASTVVATTGQAAGWTFVDDNGHGGSGSIVAGPSPTPLGAGSAQLGVTGTTQGYILTNATYGSTRLDKITNLTYSTFQPAGISAPIIEFDVRFRPNDTGYRPARVHPERSSCDHQPRLAIVVTARRHVVRVADHTVQAAELARCLPPG